jgi:hypothetical protein
MKPKMATVNALKDQNGLKNEVKNEAKNGYCEVVVSI